MQGAVDLSTGIVPYDDDILGRGIFPRSGEAMNGDRIHDAPSELVSFELPSGRPRPSCGMSGR